jgi:hypothetical protein
MSAPSAECSQQRVGDALTTPPSLSGPEGFAPFLDQAVGRVAFGDALLDSRLIEAHTQRAARRRALVVMRLCARRWRGWWSR